ncbi:S8 family serine peptidase [Salinithrix halophila]|uniref:S8 family serine peptidase n=2 Tax=Salinithrix halophila TaxID=1485204 RepID=A0ABV8JEV9_9BACL
MALSFALVAGSLGAAAGQPANAEKKVPAKVEQRLEKFMQAKIAKGVPKTGEKRASVVVELATPPAAAVKGSGMKSFTSADRKQLVDERAQVIKEAKEKVPGLRTEYRYGTVFSGFSAHLKGQDVKKLAELPGVKKIWPNTRYKANMKESASLVGAPEAWKKKDSAGNRVTGKGIKVAVVDTGVDGKHPDLKGKVVGGYDFVDKDATPQDGNGHGTHVAGTVAANGKIKGVAPGASILAYRVLDDTGSGYFDDILAGVEKAVKDGAQVMNLSLGAAINSPEDPLSIAMDVAALQGTIPVVANGNDGPGEWTLGTPASSREAISVGASTKKMTNPDLKMTGEEKIIRLTAIEGSPAFPAGAMELVDVGFGNASDYKGKDVKGKIAVARRGGNQLSYKAHNAHVAGAAGLIVFGGFEDEWLEGKGPFAPTAATSSKNGRWLKNLIHSGKKIGTFELNKQEMMASFTSEGPVAGSWMVKPDVSAPGVNITSTVPGGKYDSYSGTSMASPHVAGAAALVKQSHPNWNVREVKAALANTAVTMHKRNGKPYPVMTQGSGRIDIPKAIDTQTLIVPSNLSFGKLEPKSGKVEVTRLAEVKNLSKKTKTYRTEVELYNGKSRINLNAPASFRVKGRSTAEMKLEMHVDTNLPRGIYTGVVRLKDGGKALKLPFTVMIDPKGYPLVSGFSVNPLVFSPNGDKVKDQALLSWYLPTVPQSLNLYATRLTLDGELGDQSVLHSEKQPKEGLITRTWEGKNEQNKSLPDGPYYLDLYAVHRGEEYGESFPVVLDRSAPKLRMKTKFSNRTIKGNLKDLLLEPSAYWFVFGSDPVMLSWKKKGSKSKTWTRIPVMGQYEWENNLNFTYSFKKGALKKGTHTLQIKAVDAAGNERKKEIKVTVK